MRKALLSLFSLIAIFAMMVSVPARAGGPSPTAANIFSTIGGTTTIDQGGAIHSQARSIYSLGGGQVSFKGKRVSLFAADPPSFSAGCSGISWHFGGFAFISLDEIRQLVEAVAQASLGVAIDLAMETLCPQCYAVMAKLREISNMMRNAAADACAVANALKRGARDMLGLAPPSSRKGDCSKYNSENNTDDSWLSGVAGSACRALSSVETRLGTVGTQVNDWLYGGSSTGQRTPSADQLELTGNVTYQALTSLGYADGFIKDMLLSILGMSVMYAEPGVGCATAFSNLKGSTITDLSENTGAGASKLDVLGKPDAAESQTPTEAQNKTTPATAAPGGATKSNTVCYAAPIIKDMGAMAQRLICGFFPQTEGQRFANSYLKGDLAKLKATSLGAMCLASAGNSADANVDMYTCRGQKRKASGSGDETLDCTKPTMAKAFTLLGEGGETTTFNGYTGLAWMVGDALYRGVLRVTNNQALDWDTLSILNGSGYPLYRIINLAAVYPSNALELINVYASTIAVHYTLDTMTKVANVGTQPSIDLTLKRSLSPNSLSVIREQIMNLLHISTEQRQQALARLAEKRTLVEHIVQVNRVIQSEVISQGLNGNSDMAVSLKRAAELLNKP